MSKDFHYFSLKEYVFQKNFQGFRDRLFSFIARGLTTLHIRPNTITLASFISIVCFAYFCLSKPWLALIFLLLHVVLDGLDGTLARLTGKSGPAGALLDMLNDHTGFVIVVISLAYYALLNPILGLAYVYLYTLWVFFLVYQNMAGIPAMFTVRTKYFLYLVYVVWALMGVNIFFEAVAIFSVITFISLIQSMIKTYRHFNR